MLARFLVAVVAMAIVVVASNYLVAIPVEVQLGPLDLKEILTWGAFTYPFAFLVTDLTNRHFGPKSARIVVLVGFSFAVYLSLQLANPRIAVASGSAFLIAQLLDISIFDRLRSGGAWWRAPLISSSIASAVDTAIFFSLAFAPVFVGIDNFFAQADSSLGFGVPLLSMGPEVPLYVSLGLGDLIVKGLMVFALLAPYNFLRQFVSDRRSAEKAIA
ncbi:VUT family protein [Maritalea porphyrae]|uniref:VUT family protein n=1 Tax=Maritalea porphyrae TaxID=880732 RepID=UPI0022AEB925|nr:VUT family protein [Maritalea porphyrae]MCZ4273921.1 VUT family protein [Maritalea porphyrae]